LSAFNFFVYLREPDNDALLLQKIKLQKNQKSAQNNWLQRARTSQ